MKRCKQHGHVVLYHPDGVQTLRTLDGRRVHQYICQRCGALVKEEITKESIHGKS